MLLVACEGKVVSEKTGEARTEERSISCKRSGYCMTCMPGYDMKMSCSLKFSPYCPGQRQAKVLVTPVKQTYESGKVWEIERVETLEFLGECL